MADILRKREPILICLLLGVLTLAVFRQVTRYDFVRFDDDVYITMMTHVLQYGISVPTITWAFLTTYNANWHPLTWISYLADVELFEFHAGGFHLTNLLLHVANVVLLFLVLRRMTKNMWRSAFVAALFAVHPLHVESVAWISERKDVLSTLFWILTMRAYVQYTERATFGRQLVVWVVFALGLMAKPMLVTLPLVLLLMDFWPLRRLRLLDDKHGRGSSLMDLVWEKMPLFGLSMASCLITYQAQQASGATEAMGVFPFPLRAANALVSYVRYIGKTLLPINLSVFYPHPGNSIPVWQIIGSAALLVIITALVVRAAKSRPYLFVGWFWYMITLIPVIGLVQVGRQAMADRYTYVPLIGLFIAAAYARVGVWEYGSVGEKATGRSRLRAAALPIVACIVVGVLAFGAWRQTGYWKDSITLFGHGIAVTRDNHTLHANMALALDDQGRHEEAIKHNREAIRIDPDSPQAHNNLAVELYFIGEYAEAWKEVRLAEELGAEPNPEFIEALREKMPEGEK